MSFALLYAAVRFLLDALLISRRSESRLQAAVLALRHQLRVLQRQVRRPRWQPADRLFLSALSRLLPSPSWSSLLPSPETLLRWHRELVHRRWAAYRSRPRRTQPTDRRARRETMVRLAEENPRCGYRRIQGRVGGPVRHGLPGSPLIDPYVRFSRVRLSDGVHVVAVAAPVYRTFPERLKTPSRANHAVVCTCPHLRPCFRRFLLSNSAKRSWT